MDFVGRDALVAAMHAWVLDKSRPLSRILEDRGALNTVRRSLLEALVAEHLKLHDGDPRKSLAALSSIGPAREELSRVADPDVQASLACVSAVRKDQDDAYGTMASSSLGASTSAGTRFRILRPHAKGGLGQVSVALDDELDRQVALKEIQERHADDAESRARFEQEAEITGKLEHPGIIPVYGLGHDLTGRPFYAMRFIQGDSLKEAIARFHADESLKRDPAERSARLRELLRRFTDVCNAVAYAHSRGVLHRDLKPGNIMLGPYGETLVVDWGLAKPLGESPEAEDRPPSTASIVSSSATLTEGPIRLSGRSGSRADTVDGSPIGTPAFASPEQLLGRLDLLGPASDVYGLGATLYALLTGRTPVESRGLDEVLRCVSTGDITPPRSLVPTIPRPLEAICRKAMAVRPEDRYESARALAEDIKRWMDDSPVSAYPEPVVVRAARWVRRHQRLVTGAAAAVLVGVSALAIAYSRESSINRDLRQAKRESDRRLDLTLQAIEDYYTGVGHEFLLSQREFRDLRARLLEKPRQFYELLTTELESASDEHGRSLLARARFGLGRLMYLLGRHPEAGREAEAAIKLYHKLVAERPESMDYRDGLANCHNSLGPVQSDVGDKKGAAESYRQAIAIYAEAVSDHPDVLEYQYGLATTFTNLGKLQVETGDFMGGVESYRQTLEISSRLVRAHPAVPDYLDSVAGSYNSLGVVQLFTGDLTEAVESHRRAIGIRSRLVKIHPDVPEYQEGLARSYTNLGNVQSEKEEFTGGAESYRRAIEIRSRLVTDQPNIPAYQYGLATSHNLLGAMQSQAGRLDAALASYVESRTILERLVKEQPHVLDYRKYLAGVLTNLGRVDIAQGPLVAGTRSIQEGRGLLEGTVRE